MRGGTNVYDHDSAPLYAGKNFASVEIIFPLRRPSRAATIVLSVVPRFPRTSECQTLSTDHPFLFIVPSRYRSLPRPACWLPSTSTTRLASRQAKSAKYGPIGNCLTNLYPFRRRPRSSCHNASSASFSTLRSSLARPVRREFPPRMALPLIRPFGPPSPRKRGEGTVYASQRPFFCNSAISRAARSRRRASRKSFSTAASSDLSA
jgi:hypothetical protein